MTGMFQVWWVPRTEDWGSNVVGYIHVKYTYTRLYTLLFTAYTYSGCSSHVLHAVPCYLNLTLTSLLFNWCVYTIIPKSLTFIDLLANLWLARLFYVTPCGLFVVHDTVTQSVYILTWHLKLYFNMAILNISTPLSNREMGNHLNQMLGHKT